MNRSKRAFYRKLPIEIIAFKWFGHCDKEPENDLVRYFRRPDISGTTLCSECDKTFHLHGWIDTLEDGHRVCPGDWIIKGVAGEYYPCKPEIFKVTYEAVSPGGKL